MIGYIQCTCIEMNERKNQTGKDVYKAYYITYMYTRLTIAMYMYIARFVYSVILHVALWLQVCCMVRAGHQGSALDRPVTTLFA